MLDPEQVRLDLSDLAGGPVTITGAASLGAQRSTLFVDYPVAGSSTAAVAQISTSVLQAVPTTLEAHILGLVHAAGVPVPEVLTAVDELPRIKLPAMVVTRVDGETVPRQILRSLPGPDAGHELARACGVAMARIHGIDPTLLPASLPSPTNDAFLATQTEVVNLLNEPRPVVRYAIEWLRQHPIADVNPVLVHGDFRNGNLAIDRGHLNAVLDWELTHRGDPMEDLAWFCLRTWRFGNDHAPAGGFGSLAALIEGYEQGGGTFRSEAFTWWSIARSVWWANGLASQGAAFSKGLTDLIVLAASGRRVPELEYDLLTLINQS